MREMTKSNLRNAFSGESMAHVRYRQYSEKAREQDLSGVALLFEAIAFAEYVHARNHNRKLAGETEAAIGHAPFSVGETLDNLNKGIEGEEFEIQEMYPSYKEVASLQEENTAELSFNWALEAEKIHLNLFKEAKDSLRNEGSYDLDKVSICERCGYTTKGEPPEECPICGAKKKEFKIFT